MDCPSPGFLGSRGRPARSPVVGASTPCSLTVVAGRYRSIEPPSKIVFSWTIEPPDEHAGIESEVTVTIRRDGAAETELVIRHEKLTRAGAAARHDQGWCGALDQLARMMEAEGLPARAKG
jgi:uncharacterized protein YndB with AHSA1/START domain